MLGNTEGPLSKAHDLLVLDLDGVVYISGHAVERAPEALARARAQGLHLAFITNNASRPPAAVAANLTSLGVEAHAEDVVTSAQAAARLLSAELAAGDRVYVIGADGLEQALQERGLKPVTSAEDGPVAVVQGYGADVPWSQVRDGAILVRSGLPWVASNTDMTIPTAHGPGPGNGTLVKLVAEFAGRTPKVAGKPEVALFDETLARVGGQRPLMIGDRLDTDIGGAVRVGWPSLLVLTGVTGLSELVTARPEERPTYVGANLDALEETHRQPEYDAGRWRLGGWTAAIEDGELAISGSGRPSDWWRVAAAAGWQHLDETGTPIGLGRVGDGPR